MHAEGSNNSPRNARELSSTWKAKAVARYVRAHHYPNARGSMLNNTHGNSLPLVSGEIEFRTGKSEFLERLSTRQREIASFLVSSGLSCKQLADRLGLSEGTVRKHTEQIYRALHVHSRPELVALHTRQGTDQK